MTKSNQGLSTNSRLQFRKFSTKIVRNYLCRWFSIDVRFNCHYFKSEAKQPGHF